MEIQENLIKIITAGNGAVYVGQDLNELSGSNRVKLQYPFRFMLDQSTGNLKIGAPLLKEEWIIIDLSGTIELQVNEEIKNQYIKYCNAIFGVGLVLPDEKKIIR